MIALHGAWSPTGRLALWTEDPALCVGGVPTAAHDGETPTLHPFCGATEGIAEWLERDDIDVEQDDICLLLPSTANGPSPSPSLWLDVDDLPPEADRLRPWTVLACLVDADKAGGVLDLLTDTMPAGHVAADDLRALTAMARFARTLVARGQIRPILMKGFEGWEARWTPRVSHPADATVRRAFIENLPPVLRGAGALRAGDAPWDDAIVPDRAEVVDGVMRAITDALVRQKLPARPLSSTLKAIPAWDAFAAAAVGHNAMVDERAVGLAELRTTLAAWSRSPAETEGGGLRTTFRVSEPVDAGGPWSLEILLQAVDDPTLLVPAEQVWHNTGQQLFVEGRRIHRPQERLLGDLGRAARLSPLIAQTLKDPHPRGCEMTTEEAWSLLRESTERLTDAGFGVLAPRWWNRPRARIGRKMAVKPAGGSGGIGLSGVVDYKWEVAIGDDTLTEEELAELVARKAPLVEHRGQWIELRAEDLDAALAFYQKQQSKGSIDARSALQTAMGLDGGDGGLPITGVTGEGWLAELFGDSNSPRYASIPTPAGIHATLRPYQERGLGWLAWHDRMGLGACLADDMGLGKTIQLLALMVHEREQGAAPAAPAAAPKRGRPSKADLAAREAAKNAAAAPAKVAAVKLRATLLICPTSLVGNWQREAARFAPSLRVVIHHGPQRSADIADQLHSADLVITTYGTVARDYHAMSSVTWGRVVLDEAQNIKNSDTQQTKAVRGLSADRRVALTGTPIENRLSELWSLFEFLNPGLLGSADRFQKRFTLPIERDGDVDRAQLLRNITGPFLLRRLKTDKSILAELPEKIEVEVPCQLTREQGALYQAVVDDLLGKLNDGTEDSDAQKKGHVLAAMTRLKQVCDHPALLLGDRSAMAGRSGKLNRIEELLEEVLAAGEKALLFTQFAELGHQLKTHLQERFQREVLFLHGGTSRQARDTMVARFSEESGPPIFLLSLRAGGTGLNLVAANHVIHVDRWWNPAVEDQASDRAFRIGQTKNVQVRKMVCMGTLEEKIAAMLADKRKLAASVVGTGESWLADLSLKAIRDLVALNARDAIED